MTNTQVLFSPDQWLNMKVCDVLDAMNEAGAGNLKNLHHGVAGGQRQALIGR